MTSPFDPQATTVQIMRYMVAVADHRSFRQAALACFVAQPSLSTAIAQWEQRMDCRLFERDRRQVHITAVGKLVIAAARETLDHIANLERVASDVQAPFFGPVRLGIIPTIAPYALPAMHPGIKAAFPDLSLSISEGLTQQLIAEVRRNHIDCALVALLDEMSLFHQHALYDEPFLAALPIGHHLANQASVDTSDLIATEQLLLLDDGHCLRDQALAVCQRTSPPDSSNGLNYRATSLETLRHLVSAGHGVTLLPALAAPPDNDADANITTRPLSQSAHRRIGLIWRHSDQRSQAYQQLATAMVSTLPARVTLCSNE